jgi:hypothetical protein
MANTIQIKHSPNSVTPAAMEGTTHDLAKGELAWVDHGTGGANGKLYIGDATAAGATMRHIGGVGTGAVAAAAAAGSLTGSTLASGVTVSSLTSVGTIGTGVWQGTAINQTYLTGQSGTNTGDEVASTSSVAGVIELATDAETITGTATDRAITPANLAASTLSGGTF